MRDWIVCTLTLTTIQSAFVFAAETPVLRAESLIEQRKYRQAEELLRETIKKNPKAPAAYERLARLYADEQRTSEAIAILEKRMSLAPKSRRAVAQLAALYQQNGKFEESLRIAKSIPAQSRSNKLLAVMTADYFGLKRREEAEASVKRILALVPQNPDVVPALAKALLDQGAVGDARGLLAVAEKHQKITPSFLSALAEAQARTGQTAEARSTIDKALSMDPHHVNSLLAKSHLEGSVGEWKAAAASLQAALGSGVPRVDALKNLVFASMQGDDLQTAHDAAVTLYDLNPESSESGLALAAVLVRAVRWGEADELADKLLSKDASDKRAHLVKGIAQYNLGNLDKATKHLTASLGQGTADAEAHYMLGLVAKQTGDIQKAAVEMEASLGLDSGKSEALASLGQMYLQLGNPDKAKMVLERAVERNPSDSQNHYQLAIAYRKLGMTEKAREQMEIFQKLSVRNVPPSADDQATPK